MPSFMNDLMSFWRKIEEDRQEDPQKSMDRVLKDAERRVSSTPKHRAARKRQRLARQRSYRARKNK